MNGNGRPRLAYVIPSMRVGGTEGQLLHLMRGLIIDFDIFLYCTRSGGALVGEISRITPRVRVLNAWSGWDFRVEKWLYHAFQAHPPHIVHTFLFGFDLFAHRAARRAGIPVIVSSRRELADWQKPRHRFMQRRANRYTDAIVANSHAVADFASAQEGADPALFHVIPNGIDADAYAAPAPREQLRARFRLPQDRFIVGMVANFSPVKDHDLFLRMAETLLQRRKDIHFVLVGTGPLVDTIVERVRRHGWVDHFSRFSSVGELADLYGLMDVHVLCSKMEGFPNAILEAMAAGIPVVASSVGGLHEILRHGETGFLVTSRRPEDFADAVTHLLDNPSLRRNVGAAGAQWVRDQLPVQAMIGRYRTLYQDLLRAKMPGQV